MLRYNVRSRSRSLILSFSNLTVNVFFSKSTSLHWARRIALERAQSRMDNWTMSAEGEPISASAAINSGICWKGRAAKFSRGFWCLFKGSINTPKASTSEAGFSLLVRMRIAMAHLKIARTQQRTFLEVEGALCHVGANISLTSSGVMEFIFFSPKTG